MTDTVVMLWLEAMGMTALLIAAVLLVRRPVAALFGPRIAYALWAIPLLRLVLPPLPGGVTVVTTTPVEIAVDPVAVVAAADAGPAFDFALLVQALPFLWLVGFAAVIGGTLWRHRGWLRVMQADATPLESIGRVRLVMSAAVDGPVATGLLRPLIAVPTDFFARYNKDERALAVAHELAHHRSGDMWANAAALIVLAAQWFNPLAWLALSRFRFDQEAACDARILGAVAAPERAGQAHIYARAIAKSLAGPRLVLAAPMTSGKAVKERLQMLTKEPQGGVRPMLGRILLGGGAVAALALTVSTLPNKVVFAAEPSSEAPIADASTASAEKKAKRIVIIDRNGDDDAAGADKQRDVRRVIIREHGDAGGKPHVMMINGEKIELPDGAEIAREVQNAMPFFGLDEDELRATLAEQGIKGDKADAVVKRLREKRGEAMRKQFSWAEGHAKFAEAQAARAEAQAKRAEAHARLAIVPLIPGKSGFPMTEGTYRTLRKQSAPAISERELLERTLSSMIAARENVAGKSGGDKAHDQAVVDALDREIEHLKSKIKRF